MALTHNIMILLPMQTFLQSLPDTFSFFAARVDEEYRRQGIYSHLMAASAEARKSEGLAAPFIGVGTLNKGSHKAIKRFSTQVGKVVVIRVGSMAWARSTGGLKQKQSWTFQCTKRPIQLEVS